MPFATAGADWLGSTGTPVGASDGEPEEEGNPGEIADVELVSDDTVPGVPTGPADGELPVVRVHGQSVIVIVVDSVAV